MELPDVMNLFGQPNFSMIFHKPSVLTVSKAFVRSMKVTKRSLCCSCHFFLELACSKYHVCCSASCTKATLTFREETLLKMLEEVVE